MFSSILVSALWLVGVIAGLRMKSKKLFSLNDMIVEKLYLEHPERLVFTIKEDSEEPQILPHPPN